MNTRRSTAVLAALMVSGLTCAQRPLPDEEQARIRCSWIAVHVDDGEERLRLRDPGTDKTHSTVCTCATVAEAADPEFRSMMNEVAYERCLEIVEHYGFEAADSTCHEQYEADQWGRGFGFPEDSFDGDLLPCDSSVGGCAVQ